METISIHILDGQPVFRLGLQQALGQHPGLQIVAIADNLDDGLRLAEDYAPNVILVSDVLAFEQVAGSSVGSRNANIEFVRLLRKRVPGAAIIIMAGQWDLERLLLACKVGTAAYLPRDVSPERLIDAIQRVADGEYLINENLLTPEVAAKVMDQFQGLTVNGVEFNDTVFTPLSPREEEILQLVARGNSNREIARELGLSDQTVKNHITSVLRKLAANDRTQAVVLAIQKGFIKISRQ
jgi:DNA-binding NarL/FixJ family response regulator